MARQHNSAETREMIIASAIDLFQAKGYSKTTLEDIVSGAGLTRGAFYWNFKGKSDILDEIERRYEAYYCNIYSDLEEQPSAHETLRFLIRKNIHTKLTPNPYVIMIRYKIESAIELKDLITRQQDLDAQFVAFIQRQVQRGIDQKEFAATLPASEIALYIYTYLLGFESFITTHKISGGPMAGVDETMLEHYIDLILKPLLA